MGLDFACGPLPAVYSFPYPTSVGLLCSFHTFFSQGASRQFAFNCHQLYPCSCRSNPEFRGSKQQQLDKHQHGLHRRALSGIFQALFGVQSRDPMRFSAHGYIFGRCRLPHYPPGAGPFFRSNPSSLHFCRLACTRGLGLLHAACGPPSVQVKPRRQGFFISHVHPSFKRG